MPVGDGDLDEHECRPRIARERPLLESQTFVELAERLHQGAVLQQRLRMVWVDLEGTSQAAFSGWPVPFAEKEARCRAPPALPHTGYPSPARVAPMTWLRQTPLGGARRGIAP